MIIRMHAPLLAVAFAGVLVTGPGLVSGQTPTPTSTPTQTQTQTQTKKIIFLASPKDHGRPGRHEYEKDLRALAKSLEASPNLKGIETKVFVGMAPRDLNEFKDAAAIVLEGDGDKDEKEVHPLFPPETTTDHRTYDPETTAYLKELDALIRKGIGVVVFHYATWVDHWVARRYYVQWLGGLWVEMASTNPVDTWSMTPKNPDHPILRGVKPWTYRDEVFCKYWLPNDTRRTDLIVATPEKSPIGPQVAAWAYNRADGGRGFVMGGLDFHDNLSIVEDFRRFLLNGIVWAAGIEVPAGGVQSKPPE